MAWLGQIGEAGRLGIQQAAEGRTDRERQPTLFDEPQPQPRWVKVDAAAVRIENCRQFGGSWLALELIRRLGLDEFFEGVMPRGQGTAPWSVSAMILIIARQCEPSSELRQCERKHGMYELAVTGRRRDGRRHRPDVKVRKREFRRSQILSESRRFAIANRSVAGAY